jgi:uncharacterized lipoprotein YbaY
MIERFGLLDSISEPCLRKEVETLMHIRQLLGPALALALCFSAGPALAQRSSTNQNPSPTPRPAPDPDTVTLVQLVDAAIVAAPNVQVGDTSKGDIPLKWESAHFIKGLNGVYIPFTISFDPSSIRTSDVSLYIRAVEKSQLAAVVTVLAPPAPAAGSKPQQPPAALKYPWDNVHFLQKPVDGRITRAIALPPGDYELFVSVKERSASPTAALSSPPGSPIARTGLLRHAVLAPDFNKPELQTSSVILATAVEPVSGQLSPAEQEANPFVFGPMRVLPSRDGRFGKNSDLQLIFWVYGATAAAGGKPDVTIDFNFYLKQPDGAEKYFNKTAPQELNAKSLPAEFNIAAGHQLPGSLVVGLAPFPVGDYRLEIKVTDKPSGKVVTQSMTFTVTG